jgi:hypothetical protein
MRNRLPMSFGFSTVYSRVFLEQVFSRADPGVFDAESCFQFRTSTLCACAL